MTKKITDLLSVFYFVLVVFLAVSVYYNTELLTCISRVLCMVLIVGIYLLNSNKKDKIYLYSLLSCFISVLLFFFNQSETGVLAAGLFFIIYRVLMIDIIFKKSKKIRVIPVFLGSVPFFAFLLYVVFLTHSSLGHNFYPAIIHVLLISLMAGVVVSNYILEDDVKNIWLLTSVLFFTIMIFVFIIERYYIEIKLFKPLRSVTFFIGQYLFLRYMILSEHQTVIDLPLETIEESVSK